MCNSMVGEPGMAIRDLGNIATSYSGKHHLKKRGGGFLAGCSLSREGVSFVTKGVMRHPVDKLFL